MTSSVIMASYNGKDYIEKQLESIKNQTVKVDEVIICDDCSTDNTVDIIKRYISENCLSDAWKLIINPSNKGYIGNFLDAINMATKEIVFFSDQDDIWDLGKIEMFLKAFEETNADAIYCLDDTIDSDGKTITNKIAKINRIPTKEKLYKVSIMERLKYGRSPGLCLGFKKTLVPEIYSISQNYHLPHDLPVGLVAAAHNKYYLINEVLVHHRVHRKNASTPETSIVHSADNIDKQIKSRIIKINEIKAVLQMGDVEFDERDRNILKKALKINEFVLDGIHKHTVVKVLLGLFNNNPAVNRMLIVRNIVSLIKK